MNMRDYPTSYMYIQFKEREQCYYCYSTFHITVASSVMSITHPLKGVWNWPQPAADGYLCYINATSGQLCHFYVIWWSEFYFRDASYQQENKIQVK
jgi:hypothetical protein